VGGGQSRLASGTSLECAIGQLNANLIMLKQFEYMTLFRPGPDILLLSPTREAKKEGLVVEQISQAVSTPVMSWLT
jgi:hypothetical protein